MKYQLSIVKYVSLIALLSVLFLALTACGTEEVEPTPILPPPNVSVGDGGDGAAPGDTAVDPTLAPGQVATITAVPADEVTAVATPTLEPTPTETTTPAATPITDPPIQAVTGAQLPPTSRDLLFLADGAFKRWNYTTRQVEILVPGPLPSDRVREGPEQWQPVIGDITDFSVSADGKRAVVARLTASVPVTRTNTVGGHQYADEDTQHELWFVDLVSGEAWRIVPRVDNLHGPTLSPNGQHVAFLGASLDGNYALQEEGQPAFHIYFLATGGGNPGPVVDVAACHGRCSSGIAWHPENNLFAWSDSEAVWFRNLTGREPERLLDNRSFNPDGGSPNEVAVYMPDAWAGNGRFLLLHKGGWEGSSRSVFDVPTGALVDVPDTFVYANAYPTQVMWMPDHRLYILRSEAEGGGYRPQIELWRFLPEQNDLVLEETMVLSNQRLGAAGQQYLADGRFAYVLFSEDAVAPEAGAYHLTSLNEVPERVNAAPSVEFYPGAAKAFWPTDGSGVLIVPSGPAASIFYGPAGGDFLYDVTAVFGAEAHAFHWQPEIVIP